jgi:predicted  nucleic acid-binding Zn-ribbon protein
MGFSYYSRLEGLAITWEQVQQVQSHLRKHRDEITDIETAQEIITTYQAAGLLELPEGRSGPQHSHASTPPSFIFVTFGTAFQRAEKRLFDREKWDEATVASVREEMQRVIEKAKELLAKI